MLPDIPSIYTITFLTVEPLLCLLGGVHAFVSPLSFTSSFVPNPPKTIDPVLDLVFTNLGACYFFLSFTLAVGLRLSSELEVWEALLGGVLLSDVVHLYASAKALDAGVFWNPLRWSGKDWFGLGLLWSTAGLRLAFLVGWRIEGGGRLLEL